MVCHLQPPYPIGSLPNHSLLYPQGRKVDKEWIWYSKWIHDKYWTFFKDLGNLWISKVNGTVAKTICCQYLLTKLRLPEATWSLWWLWRWMWFLAPGLPILLARFRGQLYDESYVYCQVNSAPLFSFANHQNFLAVLAKPLLPSSSLLPVRKMSLARPFIWLLLLFPGWETRMVPYRHERNYRAAYLLSTLLCCPVLYATKSSTVFLFCFRHVTGKGRRMLSMVTCGQSSNLQPLHAHWTGSWHLNGVEYQAFVHCCLPTTR